MNKTCGRRAGYKNGTAEIDRFLSRTEYNENGCLIWTGAGYGTKIYGGFYPNASTKKVRAHAWILRYTLGDAYLEGKQVLHKCDVPKCVNPEHLFQGTNKDNMADMMSKGRNAKGESSGAAKLTDDVVREIRRLYAEGTWSSLLGRTVPVTAAEMGRTLGVSQSCVMEVVKGNTWKHVV